MTYSAAKPLVVLQNDYIVKLTAPAAIAARTLGITIHDVPAMTDRDIAPLPTDGTWEPIFVMGSLQFVDVWARGQAELRPWLFWNDANYDAARWTQNLGEAFLNFDGHTSTIGDFIETAADALHVRPRSAKKIIGDRPRSESVEGRRSIAAMVTNSDHLKTYAMDGEIEIWASPPKQIDAEVRVWMIGGKVAGASTYRITGRQVTDSKHQLVGAATQRAQLLHERWAPDRHYVVDLALHDGDWKLVEYNPIHCSGWYDADPASIIEAFMVAETST